MPFYIVFGGIAVLSLVAALFIVARKFPQLTMIDAEALQKERDVRKKREIIKGRVDRMASGVGRRVVGAVAPAAQEVRRKFRALHAAALELERRHFKPKKAEPAAIRAKIEDLLDRAEALRGKGELPLAEKRYIEVIALERKNADAYRGLGQVYLESKRYAEARDTYAFLAKMAAKKLCGGKFGIEHDAAACTVGAEGHSEIAKIHVALADAMRGLDDREGTKAALEAAVSYEGSNPRLLDLLLEECILGGAQERAAETLAELERVNPENNKLTTFRERIAAMGEKRGDEVSSDQVAK